MSDARPDDDGFGPAVQPVPPPPVWASPVPAAPGAGSGSITPVPEWLAGPPPSGPGPGGPPVAAVGAVGGPVPPPPVYVSPGSGPGGPIPPPPVRGAGGSGPPGGGPPPGPGSPLPAQPGGKPARPAHRSSGLRSAVEWAVIIAVALLGALLIRTVLFQAFFIPSASMDPTLKVHDRILVNKLSYRLHPVHRGDIVVFKRSPNMAEQGIKDLVKRVIGLPGETIQSAPDGQVEIDGHILAEPYLVPGINMGPPITKQIIPAGEYFVMGDNRDDSADSRVFGPIKRSQIVGRAFILIWPIPDFRLL